MYKIAFFDKKLCYLFRHHLDMVEDNDCEIYTIWQFYPRTCSGNLKNFINGKALCKAGYFPLMYWLVLVISIMGCIYSFKEFTSLFWYKHKSISMWRSRKFYVLPCSVLRKCRLVGSLIMSFNWFLLWYAVVKVSPTHMTPWLTINMFVLSFELITWIIEVLMGVCKLDFNTFFSFAVVLINYWFVLCVQSAFEKAIAMNDIEDLRLWKNI